jgi:hypothetical protein
VAIESVANNVFLHVDAHADVAPPSGEIVSVYDTFVKGLTAQPIHFESGADLAGLWLEGPAGPTTFNILELQKGPTTVATGNGQDNVYIDNVSISNESKNPLLGYPGTLTVNGGGNTTLSVFDQDEAGDDSYTFTSTPQSGGLTAGNWPGLTYTNIQSLILDGSSFGTDVYTVEGTAAGTQVTLGMGTGDNQVNVTPSVQNVQTLGGNLSVVGGAGHTTVTLNDQHVVKTNSYTIKPDGTTVGDPITVGYSHITALVINGAAGGGNYDIEGLPLGVSVTINPGAGPNTFQGSVIGDAIPVSEVTTTADSGPGSLRQAILDANASGLPTIINFDIPTTDPGYDATTRSWMIMLLSALPVLPEPVILDGTTQSGYIDQPVIELDGADAGADVTGLTIAGGNSTVMGLDIGGFSGDGIELTANGTDTIQGNFIGTDISGTTALANGGYGVDALGSSGNTIGGLTDTPGTGTGNLISGNSTGGMELDGSSNTVEGNLIGVDQTGNGALGNGYGVAVLGPGNTIGGTVAGACNVISSNRGEGVLFYNATAGTGPTPAASLVAGNLIGLGADGTTALGNSFYGIYVALDSRNVIIGGSTTAARNVISDNVGFGVITDGEANGLVVQGNYIGTDSTGELARGNHYVGVYINSPGVLVGGLTATPGTGPGNVVSANGNGPDNGGGIVFSTSASGDIAEGNIVGLDASGTSVLGSPEVGVDVQGPNVAIGGTAAGAGNIIAGGLEGVVLETANATGDVVQGNYIGTDISGTHAVANQYGVVISAGATSSIIGGTAAGASNVISGNAIDGVLVSGSGTTGNMIEGNYIGTDVTGTKGLANGEGVFISTGGGNNTIGGSTATARNIISGNRNGGVEIKGAGTTGNVVEGDYIGIDVTGSVALANSFGVAIDSGAASNIIGGTAAGTGNVISGNASYGIDISSSAGVVVQGNRIGTDASGAVSLPNGTGIGVNAGSSGVTIGGTIGNITVRLSGGNNALTISSVESGQSVTVTNAGKDTITLGNNGDLTGILGNVSVFGTSGAAALKIDDSQDASQVGRTVILSSGGQGIVQFAGLGTIAYIATALVALQVSGDAFGNTFIIQSTPVALSITAGTGNDRFVFTNTTPLGANVTLAGGGGNDTLQGPDTTNVWQILGANSGTLDSLISFSAIHNLTGGAAADTFALHTGGSISGTIDGGGGTNTLDYSAQTGPVTVNLGAGTASGIDGTFANIGNFVGSAGSDTVIGPNDPNSWDISGANAESVSGSTFASFENLTGGSGADQFVFFPDGSVSGNIDGGGGANTLDYSNLAGPVTVNLQTDTAPRIGGRFTDISNFVGSAGFDTVIGPNDPTTWDITGANAESVSGSTFASFENLTGGSGADKFVFFPGGGVSGNIDGGGGNNTLNYSDLTGPVTVNLQSDTASDIGGTFANIDDFRGSASSADILRGPNAGASWDITGANTGSVNGSSFSSFENLTGGAGPDQFVFLAGGSLVGDINGGGGSNTLDYSKLTGPVTVNLQSDTASDISRTFANIDDFVGSASSKDMLIGPNAGATWDITGANTGSVSGSTFASFENLTGGSGADEFVFFSDGSVSGNIDGGGGSNTLDYSNLPGPVTFNFHTDTVTGVGGTYRYITNFVASAGSDILIGPEGPTTWDISPSEVTDGSNVVRYNGSLTQLAVNGGSNSDVFNVTPSATTTFVINGNGAPPPVLPGDTLDVNLQGTAGALLTGGQAPSGFQGSWTFANRMPINFSRMETLQPSPPSPELAQQLQTDGLLLPILGTPQGLADAFQQFQLQAALSMLRSPAQTMELIVDEIFLMLDDVLAITEQAFRINDLNLQSDITARQLSIGSNPVYQTQAGYLTGLLAISLWMENS